MKLVFIKIYTTLYEKIQTENLKAACSMRAADEKI
jgi:hypothetical protein